MRTNNILTRKSWLTDFVWVTSTCSKAISIHTFSVTWTEFCFCVDIVLKCWKEPKCQMISAVIQLFFVLVVRVVGKCSHTKDGENG